MRFRVTYLLKQPVGTCTRYQLSEEILQLEDVTLWQMAGMVELVRTNRGILVRASLKGMSHGQCARCLAEVDYPLDLGFEEEFLPVVDVLTGAPIPLPEESDNFTIGPDLVLDLHESVRQYAIMAQPLAPLCRPDCRGLCPQCGGDLNAGECRCPAPMDSRWAALKALAARLREE
jgi:uncharacterized protein